MARGADYWLFLKGNQPHAFAKAQQLLPGALPPQAQTVDKGHGRVEDRRLWQVAVNPATVGLAGAAQLVRDHWRIENGQHDRRDRTQDEDRCPVRETNSARVLSLCRSLAIYLYEAQRGRRGGRRSLPDYEHHIHRRPTGLIGQFLIGAD